MAESLFDEGRQLLEAGRLEEACAKLDASNRMAPAVGTLLNLGDCYERRGRFASAWSTFRAASSLALSRGDARAEFARKRSEAVQPRLSTLTVVIGRSEPGLRVKRDGVLVDDAAFGTPLPIDPGVHVVEAQAPGKKTWTSKITVAEGPPTSSYVRVEGLVADPGSVQPPAPHDTAAGPPPAVLVRREEPFAPVAPAKSTSTTVRALGFVGIGLGLVSLGASGLLAIRASGKWSDAEPHCDGARRCDQTGFDLNHDARQAGDWATVTFTAGLVLAAAGTLVVLLTPSRTAP